MDIQKLLKEGTFERSYRKCTSVSSLSPNIAYAMNQIAGLDQKDRVLDPCCGSGTILIERQLILPVRCTGVDIDPKTLECAQENIDEAKISDIILKHGDISDQNFPEGAFTKIISNLPFGIHSGSREKNIKLYHTIADKAEVWLVKGGKIVLYTQAKKILWNAFADKKSFKFIAEYPIELDGLTPSIFVFEKV